jgi:large conductance mechanosensitive channel
VFKGYKEFIMRGNVIDLAVAVVIGAAFGQVVNSLVTDVITPVIGTLVGVPDFSGLKMGPIVLGRFLNAIINFLFVSAAIYFLVIVPMNELAKRKKEETKATPTEPSEEVKLLREILAELKKKA